MVTMSVSKHPIFAALFFLVLVLLFKLRSCTGNSIAVDECPEIEKQSLLSFKHSLQDPENKLSSWNGEFNCCKWEGVLCSNLTGHVHQLNISGSYLSGKVSPSLLNLKHLKHLDLSQNQFFETIPSFIGSLTSLEYLNLSFVDFQGKIPCNIGNLSNLHTLSLQNDGLKYSLEVDSLEWLSGLFKLQYLNMNGVNLIKAFNWPQQVINKLPSLIELHLSGCNLNFTVVPLSDVNNNISTCKLAILDLSRNRDFKNLIHVPRWIFQLKNLIYLDLSRNQFSETIPSFIGSLTSLEYLDLSSAEFYGKIPHTLGNLSNLHTLSLESDYSLKADSLEWLSRLSKLEHLNMHGVNLSTISNWPQQVINKLPSLVELDLRGCSLNFTLVPLSDVNNITRAKLAILDLSDNKDLQTSGTSWIFHLQNLIHLDLSFNNIKGPLPPVSNTTKLKHIDLSNNQLINSNFQEFFYFLKDLEFLNLGSNNLEDTIYNSIANLTSLRHLELSGNELSGKLPRGITNLCKLQYLDLSFNNFQGGVSDLFGNVSDCFLGALESLDLRDNQISGPITDQFGEFKSLRFLVLRGNSLSSVIPSNLGNLSFLQELNLAGNKLTGNLPKSIGQLSNLRSLHIGDNMLTGIVTETHFSHLSRLEYLYARRNNLTLRIGPNWIPPFKLRSLYLDSCNLDSPFPSWLLKMSTIEVLELSNTGIYGNVPNWIWSIQFLNLSHNQLSGNIPFLSSPPNVDYYDDGHFVYLGSNNFSGQLPRIIGNTLCDLDLSQNSFSGNISNFLCNNPIYTAHNLHLGGNHLIGELPENCFMNWPSLRMLNLSNNNLSGRIPNSIGFLENLESLNLHGNNLSGDIPSSMHNCAALVKIDISNNNLSGNLPKGILTSLSELAILILKTNKLSGEITSAICQLSHLQILDLSDNMFSGMIPRCLNNLTAMTTKRNLDRLYYSSYADAFEESASIATKGKEATYDKILSLVTSIDLSKNNLSGDIPNEITSLVELRTLNLSSNHLTGLIPHSIGNMNQLESLDFSINSLSGALPNSFTAMSALNYLNVSLNNLTGRIPESTQLCSLNESSFIGNNLWGPPLTSSCSAINDVKTPGTMHPRDEESDHPEIEWLYVFISLGYTVGLSAFLSALYLKRSWRQGYFELLENMWDSAYVYVYIKWRRLTTQHQV